MLNDVFKLPPVPDVCPEGYFGVNCTQTCNCEGNKACDKETADCYSTSGLCAPGYASNEVRLADCQYCEYIVDFSVSRIFS